MRLAVRVSKTVAMVLDSSACSAAIDRARESSAGDMEPFASRGCSMVNICNSRPSQAVRVVSIETYWYSDVVSGISFSQAVKDDMPGKSMEATFQENWDLVSINARLLLAA